LSQGNEKPKPYGEIYVATSRRHYELITRAAEILETTRSGFVREFMLNPLGIIEAFIKKVEHLESRVRELEEALLEVAPVVEAVSSMDGSKFLISIPKNWEYMFERFVSLRALEDSLRVFIYDYSFNYIDPKSITIPIGLKKISVNLNKALHVIKSLESPPPEPSR